MQCLFLFHIIPFLSPTMLSLPVSLSIQLSCPIGRHERAKEGTRSRPPCPTRSGESETEGELLIRGVQLFTMSFEAARIFTQVTPTARPTLVSPFLKPRLWCQSRLAALPLSLRCRTRNEPWSRRRHLSGSRPFKENS